VPEPRHDPSGQVAEDEAGGHLVDHLLAGRISDPKTCPGPRHDLDPVLRRSYHDEHGRLGVETFG